MLLNDHAGVLSLALSYAILAVTPGPSLLMIAQVSLSRSRRHALMTALGLAAGAGALAAVLLAGADAATGDAALRAALRTLFACLLIWQGLRTLGRMRSVPAAAERPLPGTLATSLALGLATALTNPVTIAFFVGLGATGRCGAQACLPPVAFAVVFCVALAWFGGLAVSLSHPAAGRRFAAAVPPLRLVMGLALVGYGVHALAPALVAWASR